MPSAILKLEQDCSDCSAIELDRPEGPLAMPVVTLHPIRVVLLGPLLLSSHTEVYFPNRT